MGWDAHQDIDGKYVMGNVLVNIVKGLLIHV